MVTRTPTRDDLANAADTQDIQRGQAGSEVTQLETWEPLEQRPSGGARSVVAISLPVVGAAIMIGGIFSGVSPRIYAGVAALLGVAVAAAASRIRHPLASTAVAAGGIFVIGLLMVVPTGTGNIPDLRSLLGEAVSAGNVLRPPVPFLAGWHAVLGWVMAIVGFQSAWVALRMGRFMTGMFIPLPVSAVAAISVPEAAQFGSGLALLGLLAVGLGLGSWTGTGADAGSVRTAYQLRRAVRGILFVIVVIVVAYALARFDFLFPDPLVNPQQEAQKPRVVPLSEVEDRVLFEVRSSVSGPWRIGSLDVYDGVDWRLPPVAQHQVKEVPSSGILVPDVEPAVRARFKTFGLGGAVLPTLPNTVRLVSRGPSLAFDSRNDNIRLVEGQVEAGQTYDVAAAGLPSVGELRRLNEPVPLQLEQFTRIDPAPPAVAGLIEQAPKRSKWEQFDFLRTYILDNVTAVGSGSPKSITPERVGDMVSGTQEGSPFEIVAAQAMLARWVGVPSRIGYGFDGGDFVGDTFQVRPSHGAAFVEVWFPRFGWLPVIGTPKKAKATTSIGQQRVDPNVLPSEDIAIRLLFPVVTEPESVLGKRVQRGVLIGLPTLVALTAAYFTWPIVRKARRRARRRARARELGPEARIAAAYAEWRETATDLGCHYPSDTPILFLSRFQPDEEHSELAWLVTRSLWGDLHADVDDDLALYAEELSRSLRRRMSSAQPSTIRTVATVSRTSLRDPYMDDDV